MDTQKLTREQQAELAFEVMDAVVCLVGARHSDGALALSSPALDGVEWETIARQLAVWMRRLPGDRWHLDLPND